MKKNRTHIDVNFSSETEEQRLYARIVSARKGNKTLSAHARDLLQIALDATTATKGKRK